MLLLREFPGSVTGVYKRLLGPAKEKKRGPPWCGGFLFRLAKMEHPDNQRDSEKNRSAIRKKALSEKRSNPGSFWFTAEGGRFFQRHKKLRVATLASE
jgi:hypothetical protein